MNNIRFKFLIFIVFSALLTALIFASFRWIGNSKETQSPPEIYGDMFDNVIFGNDGPDKILGAMGDDTLSGGEDNDILDGGLRDDYLFGDAGNDEIYGRIGNDHLYGGKGDDDLYGGLGNDKIYPGIGRDNVDGGHGTDTIVFIGKSENFRVTESIETVKGKPTVLRKIHGPRVVTTARNVEIIEFQPQDKTDEDRTNIIFKTSGKTILTDEPDHFIVQGKNYVILYGRKGDDRLIGGPNRDEIFGGEGKDYILGGREYDELTGGGGKDVFDFRNGDGSDWILDFTPSEDKINFSSEVFKTYDDIRESMMQYEGEDATELRVSQIDFLRLENISIEELSRNDFSIDGRKPKLSKK